MMKMAVIGSGMGSNFKSIMIAIREGKIPNTEVRLVVSNNSSAGILALARSFNVPAVHLSQTSCGSEEAFTAQLLNILQKHEVNFIVLAGYMKQLHQRIVAAYRNRIVNIHPALLPRHGGRGMYGMRVHEAVIAARERVSGATVHFVDEEYDRGEIILQREVPVEPADTPGSLAAKVLAVEHQIYPEAIRLCAEGRMKVVSVH